MSFLHSKWYKMYMPQQDTTYPSHCYSGKPAVSVLICLVMMVHAAPADDNDSTRAANFHVEDAHAGCG